MGNRKTLFILIVIAAMAVVAALVGSLIVGETVIEYSPYTNELRVRDVYPLGVSLNEEHYKTEVLQIIDSLVTPTTTTARWDLVSAHSSIRSRTGNAKFAHSLALGRIMPGFVEWTKREPVASTVTMRQVVGAMRNGDYGMAEGLLARGTPSVEKDPPKN